MLRNNLSVLSSYYDICNSSNDVKFLLLADDTTIYLQGHDIINLTTTLNKELVKVNNWISSNKLTLNLNKTKYMISSPIITPQITTFITINNINISQVNEFKFLGVLIDSKITWKQHIDFLNSKLSLLTGIIYRLRYYLNEKCLRLIYFSLIYPHLHYCCAIWGGAYTTYVNSLLLSQKKILRVMYFKSRYSHTMELFRKHKLLRIQDIKTQHTVCSQILIIIAYT